ncbi:MAG: LCP family protein [Clostridiaceae bacterium]
MNNNKYVNNSGNKNKLKIFLIILGFIFIATIGIVFIYGCTSLSSINRDKISSSSEDLGINEEKFTDKDGITNILLMGIDSRSDDFEGRSDSIMVLTVDPVHNKLKLTSLMRDSYVQIDGHGYDKLTHAYAFGKGQLAIKTVNSNFDLNIEDYVVVDFSGLEDMIDSLEGLDISVSEEEVYYLNRNIKEQSKLRKKNPDEYYIDSPGDYHMNGLQAVAYARIRKTAGGDFQRTDRQREVLDKMFHKIQGAGISTFTSFVKEAIPHIKTSLSNGEILSLGKKVLSSGMDKIEQCRFPLDNYCDGGYIGKIWYLLFDQEATREQIHEYIFNDKDPYEYEGSHGEHNPYKYEGTSDQNTTSQEQGDSSINNSHKNDISNTESKPTVETSPNTEAKPNKEDPTEIPAKPNEDENTNTTTKPNNTDSTTTENKPNNSDNTTTENKPDDKDNTDTVTKPNEPENTDTEAKPNEPSNTDTETTPTDKEQAPNKVSKPIK